MSSKSLIMISSGANPHLLQASKDLGLFIMGNLWEVGSKLSKSMNYFYTDAIYNDKKDSVKEK